MMCLQASEVVRRAARLERDAFQATNFARPERRSCREGRGRSIRIDIVVLPDAAEPPPGTELAPARRPVNRRQREQEVQRHPLIRKAAELFDTEIVTILDVVRTEEGNEPATEGFPAEVPPAAS